MIPAEVIESIRKEAAEQAQHQFSTLKQECDRQVQFARVRIAELEDNVRRADAEGDEMAAKLTELELEKAGAPSVAGGFPLGRCPRAEAERVHKLEFDLAASKKENAELEGMKKVVMTLSRELKKRMAESTCGSSRIGDKKSALEDSLEVPISEREWQCSIDDKGHIAFLRKNSADSDYSATYDSDYMLTPPSEEE